LNKKLLENMASLFTLRGAEYIIAFITLPYLLRVLGPEKFGAITFAQTIIAYGNLLVDYGFNLTAPRDIAKCDKVDIPRNFAAFYGAKFILLIPILLVGMLLLAIFRDHLDIILMLCVLPSLLGNVIFPVWYFQGIQEMRFITVFNLIARTISVAAIFAFVTVQSDYRLAALLQSVTPIVAGVISLMVLYHKTPEIFSMPSWYDIKAKFKEGWDIFISTVFISLYTNSNVFILGIMTNDTVVGYYSAAHKLIMAVNGLMGPISSAIFPHIAALYKESKVKAIAFLHKTVRYIGGLSFLASLGTFALAEPIVHIIMGNSYEESIIILRILSFCPFVVALSNIFGVQTMVTFGLQNIFSRILMLSALFNFLLIFPLIYFWQGIGLSITVMIVETFVTITMYLVLRKNGIRLL
jgi:PST family polysaccharide transporter